MRAGSQTDAGSGARGIELEQQTDGGVLLRIPALQVQLPASCTDATASSNKQLARLLSAGGPMRMPWSDGAVISWLQARGVNPYSEEHWTSDADEAPDGPSGSRVRLALESLRVRRRGARLLAGNECKS